MLLKFRLYFFITNLKKNQIELLKLRADLISQIHTPIPEYCFLPKHYTLDVITKREVCSHCHNCRLQRQRTVKRYPVGILLGEPILRHHIKKCPACRREYPYEQLNDLIPPYGNYTYDIIIKVGLERFRYHRQNKEIRKEIQGCYHLLLPESSINEIANHFIDYFAAVHYSKFKAIRKLLNDQGGYVGHFDGTCEAGTDILFTAIDEISGIVLLTTRMTTENFNDIKDFLRKCKKLFGVPLATMRDLSNNIFLARDEVFLGVPDLICQYHFLENVGNVLFKKTHQELTVLLRKLKIRPGLKSLRHGLVRWSKKNASISEKEFNEFLNNSNGQHKLDNIILRKHLTYFVLRWLDDYSSELKGEYFPFDQPSLVFYSRCVKVYDLLNVLLANCKSFKGRQRQTLESIVRVLQPVRNNENLINIVNCLEKKVNIFKELRDILRFDRPDSKPILRQRPPRSIIKEVNQTEERLNKFYQQLQAKLTTKDPTVIESSKILINYLDKYSDKLVGHLFTLPGKKKVKLLDRTNNISEQHFSNIKTRWRRKLGTKKLTKHLQAARHEEFLVANLDQQDYINVVYDGTVENMPSFFTKYYNEAFEIRKLRKISQDKQTIPISKKTLRQPDILLTAIHAIGSLLVCTV